MAMAVAKRRILIMEDDTALAAMVQNMLQMEGFHAETVATAREGLDLLEFQAPFDLVILDLGLPDYDGLVACQMIRTLEDPIKAAIPVIICTGVDTLESRKRGFVVGAVDFVPKGDFLDDLLAAVKRVLCITVGSQMQYALIVEQDRWVRHIIQQSLKEIAIASLEAVDIPSGMELWRTLGRSINMAFIGNPLDQPLDLQLLRAMRLDGAGRDIPVIAICDGVPAELVADFLLAGGSDYITKPFHKEDLAFKLAIHIHLGQKKEKKGA